jgi:hypothetical protein
MSMSLSTGYRWKLHSGQGFASLFNGGAIDFYTGERPETADDPPTGSLIARVTQGGAAYDYGSPTHGLTFAVTNEGWITPGPGADWYLAGLASGILGWARLFGLSELPTFSQTLPRVDFDVNPTDGTSGLYLPDPSVTGATLKPITSFSYHIPPP